MSTVRVLLTGLIDYAGLFPPAQLSMHEAVRNYADYANSELNWALGRFVVPAGQLGEFDRFAERFDIPWHLAVIGNGVAGRADVEAVELKAATEHDIENAQRGTCPVYHEIPLDPDPAPLLDALARTGSRAKIRTGGSTADTFPAAGHLARFLEQSARRRVPFKATAGLHHAMRAEYPLHDGSMCAMHGFLNLFVAAVFVHDGMSAADAETLLEERDASSIVFDEDAVAWRGRKASAAHVALVRQEFATSFGSCSFEEPIGELRSAGLLA